MPEGQIMKALSGFYYVLSNDDQILYQCRARGKFRKSKETPLVGDYVVFEAENITDGYVTQLLPRKNSLVRPPVSNIDQALITVSAKEPDFSTVLLDRFLVLAEYHHIKPVILVTKMDLLSDEEEETLNKKTSIYEEIGYDVRYLSQHWKLEADQFKTILNQRLSVIAGQSGVGKSSFLNALDPSLNIETAEISNRLGRGKHTTRHVELVHVSGGYVADTPGFSSLDFDMIDLVELKDCFVEFEERKGDCKFRECMHVSEPKCAIKQGIEQGELSEERYKHYIEFYHEIKSRKPRY
ncbi:ribosome biogenesis GTPase [Pelagirhabdus alkalitolerans]|uniref:Small ribosomal subunit biogenesis GTPase RsgA n=1 Tax=Pelagirhabdus alkalitolerans TaxID=1612202 RepID=A0A1G6H1H7_9BACI|nr:ribosome small subunit-dependent GTPase A [Pelagirhabdus alkalitolerans]SDB88119.1 ribosome biogenesis GTPase [Pelagirhabdus alkalitolerans]